MPDGTTPMPAPADNGRAVGWRDALPEELRDAAALARFDDVAALAREHVHLQSLIGRKGLIPPGASATPEERAAFFTALGRPASAEDYDLSEIAPPEGMPWDDAMQSAMLGAMHEAGLTNDQARAVIAAYTEMRGTAWRQAMTVQREVADRALAGLEAEWGERFGERVDLANRAFRATFGADFDDIAGLELVSGGRVGDHPGFVRAFAALGTRMAEPELVGAARSAQGESGETARLKLRQLERDPAFRAALLDRTHPDHRAALAKRSQLTGVAFADRGDAAA